LKQSPVKKFQITDPDAANNSRSDWIRIHNTADQCARIRIQLYDAMQIQILILVWIQITTFFSGALLTVFPRLKIEEKGHNKVICKRLITIMNFSTNVQVGTGT